MRILKSILCDSKPSGYLVEYNNMNLALPLSMLYTEKYIKRLVESGYKIYDMKGTIRDEDGSLISELPIMNWRELDSNTKMEFIVAEDIADSKKLTEEDCKQYMSIEEPDTFSYENYKAVMNSAEHSMEECSIESDDKEYVEQPAVTLSIQEQDALDLAHAYYVDQIEKEQQSQMDIIGETAKESDLPDWYREALSGAEEISLEKGEYEVFDPFENKSVDEEAVKDEEQYDAYAQIRETNKLMKDMVNEHRALVQEHEEESDEVEELYEEVEEQPEAQQEETFDAFDEPIEMEEDIEIDYEDDTSIPDDEKVVDMSDMDDVPPEPVEPNENVKELLMAVEQKEEEESTIRQDSGKTTMMKAIMEYVPKAGEIFPIDELHTAFAGDKQEETEVDGQCEKNTSDTDEGTSDNVDETSIVPPIEKEQETVIPDLHSETVAQAVETFDLSDVKSKLVDNGIIKGIVAIIDGAQKSISMNVLYSRRYMKGFLMQGCVYNDIHGDIILPNGKLLLDLPYKDYSIVGRLDVDCDDKIEEQFVEYSIEQANNIDNVDSAEVLKKIVQYGKVVGVYAVIGTEYKTLYLESLCETTVLKALLNSGYTINKDFSVTLPDGRLMDDLIEMSDIVVDKNKLEESKLRAKELEKDFIRRVQDEINTSNC